MLRIAGYVFFAIGFVGILLPLLPTTIFWIVAAVCFARSTPHMYQRILAWPGFGPAIDAYLTHGVIAPRGKAFALGGMALGAFIVTISPMPVSAIAFTLAAMALAAAYVATRPRAPRVITIG